MENEGKNKLERWDYYAKLRGVCTAKKQSAMGRQQIKWQEIFTNYLSDRLVSRIYRDMRKPNTKTVLVEKWTKDLNKNFSDTNGQQIYEKTLLTITEVKIKALIS